MDDKCKVCAISAAAGRKPNVESHLLSDHPNGIACCPECGGACKVVFWGSGEWYTFKNSDLPYFEHGVDEYINKKSTKVICCNPFCFYQTKTPHEDDASRKEMLSAHNDAPILSLALSALTTALHGAKGASR